MTDEPNRGGRPPKGGVRHTVRISDRADTEVKAEATTTGTTVSDVIGAIVEDWARTRDDTNRQERA